MIERDEVDSLLLEARDDEREAWGRLLEHTYHDLKRLAHQQLRRGRTMPTLNTTCLVNEWYLRQMAGGGTGAANDRRHYFALAAKIMRQIICAYARERLAIKRGAGMAHADLESAEDELRVEAEQFLALEQALQSLGETSQTMVRVVECRFFAGMSEQETGDALGLSLRTVQRNWALAREQLSLLLGP